MGWFLHLLACTGVTTAVTFPIQLIYETVADFTFISYKYRVDAINVTVELTVRYILKLIENEITLQSSLFF